MRLVKTPVERVGLLRNVGRRVGVAAVVVVMEMAVEGPKVAVVGVAVVELAEMMKLGERSAIFL